MRIVDGRWVLNSRDFWHGIQCINHCLPLAMALAAENEEAKAKTHTETQNSGLDLRLAQGNEYEAMIFADLRKNLGDQFVEVPKHSTLDQVNFTLKVAKPIVAAQVPLSNDFEDFEYNGVADLLVREDYKLAIAEDGSVTAVERSGATGGSTYAVWDVKHKQKPEEKNLTKELDDYINQISLEYEALKVLGLAYAGEMGLVLKFRELVTFDPEAELEAFVTQRVPMFQLLEDMPASIGADRLALKTWECQGNCDKLKCDYPHVCESTRVERDYLGQLYTYHYTHFEKFLLADVETVKQVATEDLSRVQVASDFKNKYQLNAQAIMEARVVGKPIYKKYADIWSGANALPKASDYDLFVDFEWFTRTNEKDEEIYVFGVATASGEKIQFVVDDTTSEEEQFRKFMQYCLDAISADPSVHLYMASTPEKTKTLQLANRYGFDETLLQKVVSRYVNIQACAKDSIIVSTSSYGLKAVEKFYLQRDENVVTDGEASKWWYYQHLKAKESGDVAAAQSLLDDILRYNMDDCVSTKLFYEWLSTL